MPTRQEALAAVMSEIEYQDAMTALASRPDMLETMSAGDRLLAMQHCLNVAIEDWYRDSSPYGLTSEFVRKITALGVRFLEDHSAPIRVIPS